MRTPGIALVLLLVAVSEALELAGPDFEDVPMAAANDVGFKCRPLKMYGIDNADQTNITWTRNDVPISESDRQPFGYKIRKFRLTLRNVSPLDAANYTCLVESEFGSSSKTFRLSVEPRYGASPPVIKHGLPSNLSLFLGQNGTLNCPLEKFDLDTASYPFINWTRSIINKDIDSNKSREVVLQSCGINGPCKVDGKVVHIGQNATRFDIVNASEADVGVYTCTAYNVYGSDSATAFVSLASEPEPQYFTSDGPIHVVAYMGVGGMVAVVLSSAALLAFLSAKLKRERMARESAQKQLGTAVYLWRKLVVVHRSEENRQKNDLPLLPPKITIEHKRRIFSTSTQTSSPMSMETEYEFVADPKWELPRSALCMGARLGQGEFGVVVKGFLRHRRFVSDSRQTIIDSGDETRDTLLKMEDENDLEPTVVAVKMLRKGHTEQDVLDLVQEAEIMKQIGEHPNIINLIGVISLPAGEPLLLVVEYAELGNLKSILLQERRRREEEQQRSDSKDAEGYEKPLSTNESLSNPRMDCVEMCNVGRQVCLGMSYLASKKCLHRDLASRNVLVAAGNVYKIADFGMARDVESSEYYRKVTSGRVPVKWMAPESVFQRMYTTQSDVYSFGVLLWEVASLGELPFHNLTVDIFFEYLGKGRTLQRPRDCPQELFQVMQDCWAFEPLSRPTWTQLTHRLVYLQELLRNNLNIQQDY